MMKKKPFSSSILFHCFMNDSNSEPKIQLQILAKYILSLSISQSPNSKTYLHTTIHKVMKYNTTGELLI